VTGHHVARHRLRLWTFLRPSTTYAAAYLVVLLSFAAIWFRHSDFLYIGRDADLSLWLGKAYLDWARPFDVTAMNPLQSMTSMLIAINPYFNPAVCIKASLLVHRLFHGSYMVDVRPGAGIRILTAICFCGFALARCLAVSAV
jgi:hypothetical protein